MRRSSPCRRPGRAALPAALLLVVGCGGDPPRGLGGFELGMTQQAVLDAARDRGGFACRLRGTRPRLASCEGPTEDGVLTVMVREDSVVQITLRMEPGDEEPGRAVGRFVRGFGDPAWRDRPLPPRAPAPDAYHTLWLDRDSTRAMAMVCSGQRLAPPCTAELTATSPRQVEARLDTLLGIRR